MNASRINSRWSRPLRNVSKKRRKTGLMNYAKRKKKEIVPKVEPEENLIASGANSELNSEDMPAYSSDINSKKINCSVTEPINVNEEIANTTIVKEEIVIKDEVCDHSFDTTEPNITPEFPSSESNPSSNNAHSNPTSKLNHIRIGIDKSLIGSRVKGTFSLETIGSKTLIVFRRLPGESGEPESEPEPEPEPETVPKVINEKESERSNQEQVDKLYKNNSNSKKLRIFGEQRKAILKGKYTKLCSKCKGPLELDLAGNCALCANTSAKHLFSCKQCYETFDSYFALSHHIFMRCTPQGYYHCPECYYKSRCFTYVRKHILSSHPHLGIDFDLRIIKWKYIDRDENGTALSMHLCQNCGRAFQRLPNYNIHTGLCHKLRPVFKSMSTNDESCSRDDENPPSQEDDGRKKIVLHCEKCNKDTKFYHFLNCQPICINCQSKMKFRCTLCNKLIDTDSNASKHLQSNCDSQQKIKCKFCEKKFLYKHNLLKHEKKHLKVTKRQAGSPTEKISLNEADNFPDEMNSNKMTMSTCKEEKRSVKFSSKPDLTRQSKYCEKKLQMQCKVLLTRLTINKS